MCKNQYTTPSFMKNRKRELEEVERKVNTKLTCHSEFPTFRIAQDCLYCGEYVDNDKIVKRPKDQRMPTHLASTTELQSTVEEKALQRSDEWGRSVHVRIQNVGDLVAAQAKYHHDCQVRFHSGRGVKKQNKGRPPGSFNARRHGAFLRLCKHIDLSDQHQFSISELESISKSYASRPLLRCRPRAQYEVHELPLFVEKSRSCRVVQERALVQHEQVASKKNSLHEHTRALYVIAARRLFYDELNAMSLGWWCDENQLNIFFN